MNFDNPDSAIEWIKNGRHMRLSFEYNDTGLAVGWSRSFAPNAMVVEVWQILINEKKPDRLKGSHDELVRVTKN